MALMSDEVFKTYRQRLVPVLYDWCMQYRLDYATQACRWGSLVEDTRYKATYRAYLSEQVPDEDVKPNTLVVAHIDLFRPHVASAEAVSNWTELSQPKYVRLVKTIYHPGEVNKVREVPQHPELLLTHTDRPEVYLWNIDRQPDRRPPQPTVSGAAGKTRARDSPPSPKKPDPSTPDLVLVGHKYKAQWALAASRTDPRVASGGEDAMVLLWDLGDNVKALTGSGTASGRSGKPSAAPELAARTRMEGHSATVGDLVFQPSDSNVLMSVGDDGRIIAWDIRVPGGQVAAVQEAHGAEVQVMCVDWNALDENLVVTGAEAGSVQVWDRRRMSTRADALFRFDAHRNTPERNVIHVEWHPACKDVFASGSEDHTVAIWDLSRAASGEQEQEQGDKMQQQAQTQGQAPEAKRQPQSSLQQRQPSASEGSKRLAPSTGGGGGTTATSGAAGAGEAAAAAASDSAAAGPSSSVTGAGTAASTGAIAAAADTGAAPGNERSLRKRTRGAEESGAKAAGGGSGAGGGGGGGSKGGGGKGSKGSKEKAKEAEEEPLPPQLIFQHFGHRLGKITDFQWHPAEPWTIMSVSSDIGINEDKGSLQVWRPLDLLYMPEEEALAILEEHREFVLRGVPPAAPKDREREKDKDTQKKSKDKGKEKEKEEKGREKDKDVEMEEDKDMETAAASEPKDVKMEDA